VKDHRKAVHPPRDGFPLGEIGAVRRERSDAKPPSELPRLRCSLEEHRHERLLTGEHSGPSLDLWSATHEDHVGRIRVKIRIETAADDDAVCVR
jgi:hypothetical protein